MSSTVPVGLAAPGIFPSYNPFVFGQIAPAPKPTRKKIRLNLPKETIYAVDGDGRRLPSTRSHFARTPIPPRLVPPQPSAPPPDVISADIYPPDGLRAEIPPTIDVFLPRRSAWDEVKKKFIDEKLEKLGVEECTGSSMLHTHEPDAISVSISSPVDPALLLFKLNKLQQVQNPHPHSASVSQQPIFTNSPPPPAIFQPVPPVPANPTSLQHGHSPSMVAAPFIPMRPHTIFNNDLISFNSFGTSLAQDASRSPNAHSEPGPSLTPPAMPARAESPPDFIRGFGLDAPDGAEEEQAVTEVHEAWPMVPQVSHIAVSDADDTVDMELDEEDEFQEDASGSRNGNSNNASSAEEDEGEVRQIRHAVRNGGSLGEIFGHASRPSLDDTYSSTIEERLEALLENKLDGFREEVRALWAESLSTSRALHDKTSELLALYQDILSRLMTVPGSAGASMKVAKLTDAELLAHTVTEEEQSIATKVRAQDDAVRAEKDIMLERLASEHDQLCATVDEIQSVMILRATEATTLLTVERDETPSPSLTQFKTPDVTTESQQERILEPGNLNQEFEAGEQVPVSKVHPHQAQASFASRDSDTAMDAHAFHQSHCDDLRCTNESELQELRRVCERSKVLECEYAALQHRYKERDTRAAEWEQRANENAAALEEAQAVRDQAKDRVTRLEAESMLLQMRLDEKERLAKDRESKLSDQVLALEGQLTVADVARLDTCVTQ